jgi:glyoxylase I family protein
MPEFPALTHVALTVSDLPRSMSWYRQLFDKDPVLDEDTGPFRHVVWMIGDGTIVGLHQHTNLESSEPASEFRPGLDNLAFGCSDRSDLEAWKQRLDDLGIPNGGIIDASYGSGLSFRDPDNIPLEFFAPPG